MKDRIQSFYKEPFSLKDAIESKISFDDEVMIVEEILGYALKLGRSIPSPLREDKHPSFSFYQSKLGRLMYKDFALGFGDIYAFIIKIHNVNFPQALEYVGNKLGIENQKEQRGAYWLMHSASRLPHISDPESVTKRHAKTLKLNKKRDGYVASCKQWDQDECRVAKWSFVKRFLAMDKEIFACNFHLFDQLNLVVTSCAELCRVDHTDQDYKPWIINGTILEPVVFFTNIMHKHYNAKKYNYLKLPGPKYAACHYHYRNESLNISDTYDNSLYFPFNSFDHFNQGGKIDFVFITAGEKDALFLQIAYMLQQIFVDMKVVICSMGSESEGIKWDTYFRLKKLSNSLVICYDNDDAGDLGMYNINKEYPDIMLLEISKVDEEVNDITEYITKLSNGNIIEGFSTRSVLNGFKQRDPLTRETCRVLGRG